MKNISVAVATFNEEGNLANCLASVMDWVDEIVVVDGGSTDATRDIAHAFSAKVIVAGNPPIFHINKQKALDACSGVWILQLDADEVVSKELKEEIISHITADSRHTAVGYYISRKNFFLGHWLRKGGQYPDYVIRLFRRGKGSFPCKSVHEQILIDGNLDYLKEPLLHYSYRTMQEYFIKAHRYSALVAKEMRDNKIPTNASTAFQYLSLKPIGTFFSLFVWHKGFVDGIYGFLYAAFSGVHHILAYKKYLDLKRS